MAYRLSYTAQEVNEKLAAIDDIEEQISQLSSANAVLYTEQSLTAGQKAQARLNLGIDPETLKAEVLADFINATEVAL